MERLHDLLLDWEDRKAAGESVSAEVLCPDDPMLARQLSEKIRLLETFDQIIADRTEEPPVPQKIGKYEIRGTLGRGGMGVVYLAFDPALRRTVAIKSLIDVTFDSVKLRERFAREGQLLAQLEHDHIVGVYEAGMSDGQPYLVMEYFPAGSLADHRSRFMNAGAEAVSTLMEKIAGAVQHAHEAGILHRDLKPANILLDAADEPMVCDFGLAKLTQSDLEFLAENENAPSETHGQRELTGHSNRPGTLPYMAPEQIDPQYGKLDVRSDVWALGVIYFELLTGRRPFDPTVWFSNSRKDRKPVWTAAERKSISSGIRRIVEKCLSTDPDQRYQNAQSFTNALVKRRQKKQYVRWAGMALFLTMVLGSLAAVGYRESRAERKYERAVQPILEAFRKGERVELIPEKGFPPFFIREGAEHTTIRRTDEGLEIETPLVGIVEFLPDIPASKYLITAEIRHESAGYSTDNPRIGIVVSHFSATNLVGIQHLMRVAAINEMRFHDELFAEYSSLWILKSENSKYTESMNRQFAAAKSIPKIPGPQTPWVTVSVQTSDRFSNMWARSLGRSVGPLKCDDEIIESHGKILHEEKAAAEGVDYPEIHKPSLSIFVQGSKCIIRQFSVETFD